MKDLLLHTPDGVRDLHPVENYKMTVLRTEILDVFRRFGYQAVATPTFEHFDVFNHERGTVDVTEMFKIFDREGNILVLRPDITPSVARFVSTFYKQDQDPKRLCYSGNAFRFNPSYQGKLKEFTQLGCELFGSDTPDADAELVILAIDSLLSTGLTEFKVDLGQAAYFNGLVEEAGMNGEQQETLRSLIDEKNFVGVEELLDGIDMQPQCKKNLLDLPKLFGGLSCLNQAKALTQNVKAIDAIERLEAVYAIICEYGYDAYVSFDLGMVSHLHYYTGMIFKGYTYGTGVSILDGGRYDTLLAQFGKDMKAVGFAIILDDLYFAIARQHIPIPDARLDTLLVYNQTTRKDALALAKHLRSDGMSLLVSLMEGDLDAQIAYGKQQGIGGLMYMIDPDSVMLINLETNDKQTLNLSALIR